MMKKITILAELYQYLDDLYDADLSGESSSDNTSADTLFASGYIRGFISLAATDYGDEQQLLSPLLIQGITDKLVQARSELSPQDNAIVQNFWLTLQGLIH